MKNNNAQCNQEKIYLPLIKEFKEQTETLYKNYLWIEKSNDLSGLFIPHVLDEYKVSRKKVFYIGQDTYEWIPLGNLYEKMEENYLLENNTWPLSTDDILKLSKNKYTFWNFVSKIQLAINGEQYNDLKNLCDSKKKVLNQLGWGNLYSLERFSTIRKYEETFIKSFNHKIYKKLLKKSKDISKLKNILKAYEPNYVVILAWQNVKNWYFDGIEAEFIKEESMERLLAVYNVKETNAKIFWTYHPQALCRKKQDLNNLIEIILKRM